MRTYRALNQSAFQLGDLEVVPIRYADRFEIMAWRNAQIDYLRQSMPLTEEDQKQYFQDIVLPLFDQEHPEQLLFSYLKEQTLIGYGGLVHISHEHRHAEISFLLCPHLNQPETYLSFFKDFLSLIEGAARDMGLNKIYTFGYNMEAYRFQPLVTKQYNLDATLVDHELIAGKRCDVLIYSKIL